MQDTVKKDRYKYIGGSDIPIIMGLSPFKSRWELLKEKCQIEDNDFDGNEYTRYGDVMEEKIRDYLNKDGYGFYEDKVIAGDIRYHCDGVSEDRNTLLEVKTTSQIHEDLNGYKQYLVQLLFGMDVFEASHGILAVYERPEDFSEEFDPDRLTVFEIEGKDYAKTLLLDILNAVDRFRADKERLEADPFLTEEDLQPKEIVSLANPIIELEQKMATYKALEKEYKELKAELKTAMETYGVTSWTTPEGVKFTLVPDGKETAVESFDEKAFAEKHPRLAKQFTVTKTKKGRAGYVRVTI